MRSYSDNTVSVFNIQVMKVNRKFVLQKKNSKTEVKLLQSYSTSRFFPLVMEYFLQHFFEDLIIMNEFK